MSGETTRAPGVATPPMPWSISTEVAFATALQFNVDDCPGVMLVGDAVKEEMTGAPGQGLGAGDVCVGVGVG